MATSQDNKDQCRYLYHRAVTLLTVYMLPALIGLAFVADPLILTLYGTKWAEAAMPLSILCLVGIPICVMSPAGAILAAQNWLGREVYVQATMALLIAITAFLGLRWGITGVACGVLAAHAYGAAHVSWLVNRCIQTTYVQLARSLAPGAVLNLILATTLQCVNFTLPDGFDERHRVFYLLIMTIAGASSYGLAFLLLPFRSLDSERDRWKVKLAIAFRG